MRLKWVLVVFMLFPFFVISQEITGEWQVIEKETGEAKSIVKIYQENNKLYGKVIRILNEEKRTKLCTKCKGQDKNKKIEGLVLMKHFTKEGHTYINGTITNPDDGKVYRSKMWLDKDNPNLLNVRGYIGIFYKTVQWQRFP
ncbi:Uncharacterized conserved protein, DUF2147 family [Mesonia phycicola]|uniref:Uncharacterized conserved protein, DUF2147 family n=1 Tax=Mesonia phycicola TaxID=579105 RepID=A0A1M6DSD3_9FLAO|nr:DUF2147 domain-containing protein [Mesonia phycicola]SHI76039.1 Uncharacterized conserved protein, DUF2147 family [Mesonia phycicola]